MLLTAPPGSLWVVERDGEGEATELWFMDRKKEDLPFPSWRQVELDGRRVTHPLKPDYWLDLSGRDPRWTSRTTDEPIENA